MLIFLYYVCLTLTITNEVSRISALLMACNELHFLTSFKKNKNKNKNKNNKNNNNNNNKVSHHLATELDMKCYHFEQCND